MYYHANNPAGGARSPSAPVSEKRFIKMGHTCFGVSDGSSLTLTGADRHDSLVWSRKTESPTGTAHSWSPYGSGRLAAPLLPGFNGERIDPVSGSYHLGNGYRAYNPVLMRFNCPDGLSPFGAGGINPYAYCAGDPVNHTDPSGHISWQAIFGIMLGVIGLGFTIASGGLAIAAAGTVAAAFSSVSTTALVVGGLGIVADVTAIASGAIEASSPEASSILGWASLATGLFGAAVGIGMGGVRAVTKTRAGKTKISSSASGFGKRDVQINLHPENAKPVQSYKAFTVKHKEGRFVLGYISDVNGVGEPGLALHGSKGGSLVSYVKTGNTLRSKRFYEMDEFVCHVYAEHGVNLHAHKGEKLHLIACYAGGETGTAQKLAHHLNRPVVVYGDRPIRIVSGDIVSMLHNGIQVWRAGRSFSEGALEAVTHYPRRLSF